jgi:ubiquitin C-terminal hydrolase
VAYPLLLDFKKIGTMMTGRYQLSSVIEHVGIVPQMGHYKAYKRLLPESLNSNAWVEANDDIIQMRQTEEVLARKRGAYLLFYERI